MPSSTLASLPTAIAERTRAWRGSLMRSLLVSASVVLVYFVLPMSSKLTTSRTAFLVTGVAFVVLLLVMEIRAIKVSPYPRVKAFEALAVTQPMFLVVFATTYYLMGQADARAWSEPLSRLDALYFTLTVFATVGFGDITAVSEPARAVVTGQMAGNLLMIGVVTRVIVRAMEQGIARRAEHAVHERTIR